MPKCFRMKFALIVAVTAGSLTRCLYAAPTGTSNFSIAQINANTWQYNFSLHDTGSTTIGSIWFAWVPGKDFLATSPLATPPISAPVGWTASAPTHGGAGDGYGIQFTANSTASYIQPGATLTGFQFDSNDSPAAVSGNSPFYPTFAATTSVIYSGGLFSDAGTQIVVAPEPTSLSVLAVAGLALLARKRARANRVAK